MKKRYRSKVFYMRLRMSGKCKSCLSPLGYEVRTYPNATQLEIECIECRKVTKLPKTDLVARINKELSILVGSI